MHKHGEEAVGKLGLMQAWEFAAFCKALFINAAAAVGKKMAGNGIYDHVAVAGTCFDILLHYIGFGPVQVRCQPADLGGRNIDHERAAAVAAACTVYPGRNGGVKLLYKQVNTR
jgi:hypothetical protein